MNLKLLSLMVIMAVSLPRSDASPLAVDQGRKKRELRGDLAAIIEALKRTIHTEREIGGDSLGGGSLGGDSLGTTGSGGLTGGDGPEPTGSDVWAGGDRPEPTASGGFTGFTGSGSLGSGSMGSGSMGGGSTGGGSTGYDSDSGDSSGIEVRRVARRGGSHGHRSSRPPPTGSHPSGSPPPPTGSRPSGSPPPPPTGSHTDGSPPPPTEEPIPKSIAEYLTERISNLEKAMVEQAVTSWDILETLGTSMLMTICHLKDAKEFEEPYLEESVAQRVLKGKDKEAASLWEVVKLAESKQSKKTMLDKVCSLLNEEDKLLRLAAERET